MSLDTLKRDMLTMLDLSNEMGKYRQMLLHHGDMCDKRNYDPEKCEMIKIKLEGLKAKYDRLNNKWFINP